MLHRVITITSKVAEKSMFNAWCKHGKWPYHYLNKWTIFLWYNRSLKYFCYYMISAVNLQPFIGGESQIATMQTFVLIIMSHPSYRRHACLYLFTRRPRPQVSTYRVHFRFPWLVLGDMSQQHVLGLVIPCDRAFKVFPPFSWLHPWIWVKFNLLPKCWKISALLSLSCLLAERLTRTSPGLISHIGEIFRAQRSLSFLPLFD